MIVPSPTQEEAAAIFAALLGSMERPKLSEPVLAPWRRAGREPDRTFDELRASARSTRVL
ncbi:MAG: hypothetical protein HKL91_06270 [Candidatus Eremiobacteraeota bacterium]|nr:hypothetical protein [Candidatus Eremiobacteraeota bacterium]